MGIPIEKHFVINASSRDVWAFLTDPSRVAACLPGAAITGQVDERTHAGTITIKVGPVSARYKGTVRFERLDREAGVAEIVGTGQDMRGKGGADMHMTSRLFERGPAETAVTVVSTVNVTGILAQFGRGIIQDLSDQMFGQFTGAMRAALESAPDRTESPAAAGEDADSPERPVGGRVETDAPAGGERAGAESPADADASGTGRPAPDPAGAPRPGADPAGAQAPPAGGDAPGSDAIDAVSLGATVGRRALGRALRRPGFWVAVAILAAILWLLVN